MSRDINTRDLYPIRNLDNSRTVYAYYSKVRRDARESNSMILPPTCKNVNLVVDDIVSKRKTVPHRYDSAAELVDLFDITGESDDKTAYNKCVVCTIMCFNLFERLFRQNNYRLNISFLYTSVLFRAISYDVFRYNVLVLPCDNNRNTRYNLEKLFVSLLNDNKNVFFAMLKMIRRDVEYDSRRLREAKRVGADGVVKLNSNLENEFLERKRSEKVPVFDLVNALNKKGEIEKNKFDLIYELIYM